MDTQVLNYRVIIEKDEDGVFVASVPTLQGCYTEADTYEEAVKDIKKVIKLHLKARVETEAIDDSKSEFIGIKNIQIPFYGSFATN
jgi:predicted RNase H-like HicB family nuclease